MVILEAFGNQAQEIEDAIFQIRDLNENFGANSTAPRESLDRAARMFGIAFPERITTANLIYEIRAEIVVMYSRCRLEDVRRLPDYLYSIKVDIIETGDGIYLAALSALTEVQARLIFKSVKKLMPAGISLYGIIQNGNGWFGFSGLYKFKQLAACN